MIKESIVDALLFYWDELAYSPFRVFVTPSAPFALLTMLIPLQRGDNSFSLLWHTFCDETN